MMHNFANCEQSIAYLRSVRGRKSAGCISTLPVKTTVILSVH